MSTADEPVLGRALRPLLAHPIPDAMYGSQKPGPGCGRVLSGAVRRFLYEPMTVRARGLLGGAHSRYALGTSGGVS
jgi:hypothetical protein